MTPNNEMDRGAKIGAAIVAIAAALACGCERAGPGFSPAPSGSSIRITQVSPATSSTLHVGDTVDLQVTAEYALNADSGTVTLVIQAADNSGIANKWEVVTKGAGTVKLQASFVVPETSSIVVFTPLSAQGQGATSTVDSRAYKVVAK